MGGHTRTHGKCLNNKELDVKTTDWGSAMTAMIVKLLFFIYLIIFLKKQNFLNTFFQQILT